MGDPNDEKMMGEIPDRTSTVESRRAAQILLVGLAALSLVGALIVRDYGEGVDEWHNAFYGWAFLHAYEAGNIFVNPGIQYFNGPFFMMIWVVASQALHWAVSGWSVIDGHHFTVFVTFLVGLGFFYRLSQRFVTRGVALATTALFAFQPLVFGHAFINQKDTPFMVFFLISITLGFEAVDRLQAHEAYQLTVADLAKDWRRRRPWARALLVAMAVAGLAVLLDMWIFGGLLRAAHGIVEAAYSRQSLAWINALFARVATDAYKTPVDLYLAKVDRAAIWLRLLASGGLFLALRLGAGRVFPEWVGARLRPWERTWGAVIVAGGAVGATTSIRLAGPLAGAIVGLVLVFRLRRPGLWPLVVYGLAAVVTTYLTWPALWGDPVGAFLSHAGGTSSFTSFNVLFAGRPYDSTHLPRQFLPWMLAIQLTPPAVVAALVGLGVSLWLGVTNFGKQFELWMLLLWLAFPFAAVVSRLIPIYNNSRHVMFMLPVIFVLAAMGLERARRILVHRAIKALVLAGILAPGVAGIITLHPYEYMYYNALVGGMDGAAGEYDMDYWCISSREAMEYVNQVAPPGARVAVAGALTTAAPYARPDLDVELDRSGKSRPDYALACGPNLDRRIYMPNYTTIFSVHRGRARFSVVKAP